MGDINVIPLPALTAAEMARLITAGGQAGSFLARAGHHHVTVLDGGLQDWAAPTATTLATGH